AICVRRHPFFESRPHRFTFGRSKWRRSDNDADRYCEKILWERFHQRVSSCFPWKSLVSLSTIRHNRRRDFSQRKQDENFHPFSPMFRVSRSPPLWNE